MRCNVCGTVFNALETLSEQPPQEDEDLFLHQSESAPPLLTRSLVQHVLSEKPEFVEDDSNEAPLLEPVIVDEAVQQEPPDVETVATEQPVFLDEPEAFIVEDDFMDQDAAEKTVETSSNKTLWLALAAGALLLLGWQSIAAIRSGSLPLPDNSVSDSVCDFLSCQTVKKPLDLQAISLVSRNIRQHPGQDEALIITATMITNEHNLDFPAIEIILSDLDGQPMAMRRFLPEEYLASDILRSGFLKDVLIPISLEVASPGEQAVAFEIDFVQP